MDCVIKAGIGVLVCGGAFVFYIVFRKPLFRRFKKIGKVARLSCYPITSCKGIQEPSSPPDLEYATQFHSPLLEEIKAFSDGRNLILSAPDMQEFRLQHGTHSQNMKKKISCCGTIVEAIDCGDRVAEWICNFLMEEKLRLFTLHLGWSKMNHPFQHIGYLITSEPTIDYINEMIRLDRPITPGHFRPNIVISGCQPLDEENWDSLAIGNKIKMSVVAYDTRLIEKPYNEKELVYRYEGDPFETVENILCVPASCTTPLVGVYGVIEQEGEILAGDPVYACRKLKFLHSLGF